MAKENDKEKIKQEELVEKSTPTPTPKPEEIVPTVVVPIILETRVETPSVTVPVAKPVVPVTPETPVVVAPKVAPTKLDEYLSYLKEKGLVNDITRLSLKRAFGSYLSRPVCERLITLMEKHKPKFILEVGSHSGFTSGLIKFINPECMLVTLDIRNTFSDDIKRTFFKPNDKFVRSNVSCLHNLGLKFDLVLIDGDHSYHGCSVDWTTIQDYLFEKAVVILDDLGYIADGDTEPGVTQLFEEIKATKKFKTETVTTSEGEDVAGIVFYG